MRYVAFLRGINLGKRRLPMSRLKAAFEEFGFSDVATFIASGNVIFTARNQNEASLEKRIAQGLAQALGYQVDTFVRTFERVVEIAGAAVFPEDGQADYNIHVSFLHDALPAETARQLEAIRGPEDAFRAIGKEFYWLRRGRLSDSEIWTRPEAKALPLPTSSMRNLNSVRKLVAKFS